MDARGAAPAPGGGRPRHYVLVWWKISDPAEPAYHLAYDSDDAVEGPRVMRVTSVCGIEAESRRLLNGSESVKAHFRGHGGAVSVTAQLGNASHILCCSSA